MPTSANFVDFMYCQIDKINYEKIKFNRFDDAFVIDWIASNSSNFRNCWEISLCKICKSNKLCGKDVLKNCNKFSEN